MEGGACMVFISNGVCLLYVHMCVHVHKPVSACRSQRKMMAVLLC